jgi:hypothetical protein
MLSRITEELPFGYHYLSLVCVFRVLRVFACFSSQGMRDLLYTTETFHSTQKAIVVQGVFIARGEAFRKRSLLGHLQVMETFRKRSLLGHLQVMAQSQNL